MGIMKRCARTDAMAGTIGSDPSRIGRMIENRLTSRSARGALRLRFVAKLQRIGDSSDARCTRRAGHVDQSSELRKHRLGPRFPPEPVQSLPRTAPR